MKRSLIKNEENLPITADQLYRLKDALESAPVSVNGHMFDVSLLIVQRFERALKFFDDPGMPKIDGKQPWILQDGTVQLFTKPELEAVYAEYERKIALRSAFLHMASAQLASAEAVPTFIQAKQQLQGVCDAYS